MGKVIPLTMRAKRLRFLPLAALLVLASCVDLPSADLFKFATQSEREDAQTAVDAADVADVATLDEQGNDTLPNDVVDAQDSEVGSDAEDVGTDVGVDVDVGTDVVDTTDTVDVVDASDAADVGDTGDSTDVNAGTDSTGGTDATDASDADTVDADTGPDVPPPECVTSTDCGSKWTAAELGQCLTASCVKGACAQTPVEKACDDNDVCTQGDLCADGKCIGTSALGCSDGDACSADKCDPKTGCYFVAGAGCDDANACTADTCDTANACVHLAADATCSDGNACTLGDACTESTCTALDIAICNDDNACTDDSCDPNNGCVFLPNSVTCSDDDVCTLADACAGGTCAPGNKDACSDDNPCTDDACENGTGCLHVNNYVACDDGNKCTPGDTCQGGTCVGLAVSPTAFCNDANVCTDDACEPLNGCVHTANTAPCDDGLPCTVGDICAATKCSSGVSACECKKDADCATKEDGNPCNGTLVCDLSAAPYKCVVSAKTIVTCDASGDTTCAKNLCNKISGVCSYVAQSEGGTCDADGSVCTDKDVCKLGDCAPGAAVDCDDGQPCTTDSCDKVEGCVHTHNTNACNDGSLCTVGDACAGGVCVPGAKTTCDDSNPCTVDTCNASTGFCNFAIQIAIACNDNNACSQNDTCDANGVCAGSAVTCNDNEICTSDTCSPASGCVYTPNTIACNDSNACTTNDICDGAGVCLGGQVTPTTYCNDNNACTSDACDPAIGCTHGNINGSCDDGNNCTTGDACSLGTCVSGNNTCTCTKDSECGSQEDGNLCNGTLYCDLATLPYNCKVKAATIVTCSPASDSTCAKNTCNPTTGLCSLQAQNQGQTCNADNSVCTPGDACNLGTCVAAGTLACDDGNLCTNDACDPVSGCTHTANTSPCNDNNACTTGDVCKNTQCTPGTATVCDDGKVCTTDACNQANGNCVFSANTLACDDNSLCTTNDTCANKVCAGQAVSCDDGNVCTDDTCAALTGCANNANGAMCSDNNPCTMLDKCANKACQPGATINCADSNACTDDSCNTGTGLCVNTANFAVCNDNNACTTLDVCLNKNCIGDTVTCNDGNLCTSDACLSSTGCVYTPSVTCDDSNQCTSDACVPATGSCTHTLLIGASCEDGDACTTADFCTYFMDAAGAYDYTKSVCHAGGGPVCDDGNLCTDDACWFAALPHSCIHTNVASGMSCGHCSAVNYVFSFANGTCSGGVCTLGTPATCDDGNQCTTDDCQEGGGCQHPSIAGKECDDGSICTGPDICSPANTCVGASVCDDKNSCTSDSCAIVGDKVLCDNIASPKGIGCDDGDACTSDDTCDAGAQCSGNGIKCDDNNPCTDDSCNASLGCVYTGNSNSCDDGNPCTMYDLCLSSVCTGQGIPGATPCLSTAECGGTACMSGFCALTCNDGNPCTVTDICQSLMCSGTTKNCNDGDACTTDSCGGSSGTCIHTGACDDGNPCTTDLCTAGTGVCSHTNVGDGLQCGSANYCKTGTCTACGAGTIATPIDDGGTAKLVCAYDYPVWGLRPSSPSSFFSNGDSTVTDNATGLMWMQGMYSTNPLSLAAGICDTSATYGGKNDWRLPTVAELETIADYSLQTNSALNSPFYGQSFRFWAQPAIGANGFDWFANTGAVEYVGGSNQLYIKCVRGQTNAAPPANRFALSSDTNYVHDAATGVVWQRGQNTAANTSVAANTCSAVGSAWRLPTIRELESIVDRTNAPTSFINTSYFLPSPTSGQFWTSTPASTSAPTKNWFVNFTDGSSGIIDVTAPQLYRCAMNCDDNNPCTTDTFNRASWSCTHTALANGTSCGGTGTCISPGNCNCPAGSYGVTTDDSGFSKFQCVFDYPVWGGLSSLAPTNQSTNGDGTVIDTKTGLQWQDGQGGLTTYTLPNAKSYCDTLLLGSKSDWRLPSLAELESLVDYATLHNGVYIGSAFSSGTTTTAYWSGRAYAPTPANAWTLSYNPPTWNFYNASTNTLAVRCVRGTYTGTVPSQRFSVTAPNVTDNATGLTWEQAYHSATPVTQTNAGAQCTSYGHLPSARELFSILDRSLATTPQVAATFSNGSLGYWSATAYSGPPATALAVSFTNGASSAATLSTANYIRCAK